MRLICPNCDAQYEVADNVIPDQGRDVQCSNCGSTWFQEPASALAAAARREVAPDPADSAPPPDDDDDTVPEAEDILDEPEDAGAEDAAEPEPEPEPEPEQRRPTHQPRQARSATMPRRCCAKRRCAN